jgi:F0F1-type ATP synthase alpha subunit
VKGYLDDMDTGKIKEFETQMLNQIKNNAPEILEKISSTGKLDEDTESKLKSFLDKFKKDFIK